jgi:hypothetical protein
VRNEIQFSAHTHRLAPDVPGRAAGARRLPVSGRRQRRELTTPPEIRG